MVADTFFLFCFSDMLLGLGISVVAVAAKNGGADFVLGPAQLKNNMFLGFIFLLVTNLLTAIVVPLSGFTFTKKFGAALLVIYALFTTVSFLAEFRVIFPTSEVWESWYLSGRPE
jgi:Ca2+/Na+ antiporter